MKKVFLLLISFSLLFSDKIVEVLPANVQYSNEDVADFSETLYDFIQSSIADYNYMQDTTDNMVVVKENALPKEKYEKRIKKFHHEIKKNSIGYIKRRNLSNLIVLDFKSKKALKMVTKCKRRCKMNFDIDIYDKNASKQSKKLVLYYNANECLISPKSYKEINKFIYGAISK